MANGIASQITDIDCCMHQYRQAHQCMTVVTTHDMVVMVEMGSPCTWQLHEEVHGTLHAFSDNGWIDTELFDVWFNNLFLSYAPAVRPCIAAIDGWTPHTLLT